MIEEELTFQKYGYRSTDWSYGSGKRIVVSCDICKEIREVNKQAYRATCHPCSIHLRKSKFEDIITKEFLVENYINKQLSTENVGKLVGCAGTTIAYTLEKYGLKTRTPEETVDLIKKILTGREWSEEHLKNHNKAIVKYSGSHSVHWKGGISPIK